MASALPPRILRNDHQKTQKDRPSLDTLIQMGFTKQRAEKALAATGDRGVQLASDWLLSHVNDVTLDQNIPREYVLYLCPVGLLQHELSNFWEKSLSTTGWNGALAYFPHITLTNMFKAEDNKVSYLTKCLSRLEDKLNKAPGKLTLDFFAQKSFIGLFVSGPYFQYLQDVVTQFSEEVRKAGIVVGENKKQLHLSLSYQYQDENHEVLLKKAKEMNLSAAARWDVRLYSRDPRVGQSEVRKVLKAYAPLLTDELELIDQDFVFMDPEEVSRSKDGWFKGTSWLTGNTGMFPGVFTTRTAETWTWTLHRSLPLHEYHPKSGQTASAVTTNGSVEGDYDNLWQEEKNEDMYAKVIKNKKQRDAAAQNKSPRKLFIMRHGERCDFVFGRDWCDKCYDEVGNYKRVNLNLPKTMMTRNTYLEYIKDCPLTEMGKVQAHLTGDALKTASVPISFVYCSPALRCVQTASEVVKALGLSCKICIEPVLFEWLGWYNPVIPKWMSPADLARNGFNIDTSHVPFMDVKKLNVEESVDEFYTRNANFVKYALRKHEPEGGNVLMVGHAGSLDVCSRQLCGKPVRKASEFHQLLSGVAYCAVAMCEENPVNKVWELKEPSVVPLCHGTNKLYSWKLIQ
ncbi:ubiquitin-associated and SH3 domain-containing protein B-like isoform X1 [Haliotis cracherodii]|uniref:ubiquitin-associated and SH3 domain-containing protein B-like isoform X1 n=2 Tax=Haliotis cracherodii TaxID=6455 RepID=UPI0039EBE0C4